jgi:replicative DNA helicase
VSDPNDHDRHNARRRFLHNLPTPSAEDAPWDDPVPLGFAGRVPVFPAHRLPPWLAEYVEACAIDLQVPPDLPGVLALAALATTAGGRVVVEVKNDWREPTNLFTAVALPPGERKTPAFARIVGPLFDFEREAIVAAKEDVIEATVRRAVAKAEADKAQSEADRAGERQKDEAVNFARAKAAMAEAIVIPPYPRLLADDATPEALASLLAIHGGRMGLFSDEGGVFSMMAGRYSSSGPNLDVYLKGHSGSPLRVDRKGRDPEVVNNPALSMGLAIQPDVLVAVRDIPGALGRGLLGRILWSMPVSLMGHRDCDPPSMEPRVKAVFHDQLLLLAATFNGWTDPAVLTCTDQARAMITAYAERMEPHLPADLEHIRDWASKLTGHMVRIVGLLHLASDPTSSWMSPIEASTVADAIYFADYFLAHARIVYGFMGSDPLLRHADAMLPWVSRQETFTQRDLHRAHQHRFRKASLVADVLEALAEHGYVREIGPKTHTRGGRPPSPVYRVNPKIRVFR